MCAQQNFLQLGGHKALAGRRGEAREPVAVWSCFMRPGKRMETGDSILPREGLEGRKKRTECSSKESARAAIHT